jgi:beta-lactamase class A
MKVPVMMEVFRQADAGELSLTDTIKLDTTFRSMIDDSAFTVGAAKYLRRRVGQDVTILELAEQMMVVSDNAATNLLLNRVRTQRVTAMLREFGIQDGYILRCLMDIPAFDAGVSNRLTANGLTRLIELIDTEQAASPSACAEMSRILEAQEYRTFIPAGVPPDVRVGNKTGTITAVAHDTAVIHAPGGSYYLTILTDGLSENLPGSEVIAPLSRLIYEERLRLMAQNHQPQS